MDANGLDRPRVMDSQPGVSSAYGELHPRLRYSLPTAGGWTAGPGAEMDLSSLPGLPRRGPVGRGLPLNETRAEIPHDLRL